MFLKIQSTFFVFCKFKLYLFKVTSNTWSLATAMSFGTVGFTLIKEMKVYSVLKNAIPEWDLNLQSLGDMIRRYPLGVGSRHCM